MKSVDFKQQFSPADISLPEIKPVVPLMNHSPVNESASLFLQQIKNC